jgi:hypothetical protein
LSRALVFLLTFTSFLAGVACTCNSYDFTNEWMEI